MDKRNYQLAERLGTILKQRNLLCAVAESCTGGGLAAAITDVSGSSQWFDRGFITYSNEAKKDMLKVPETVLLSHGAVSEAAAKAMAEGVIAASNANVSIAITGIAGPDGGSLQKPVGTVWIAWAGDLRPTQCACYLFEGDRESVRQQAVQAALQGLIERCHPINHPQLSYKGDERYFFALWPDEKTALRLREYGHVHSDAECCAPVTAKNLHLTLVYLGRIYPDFIDHLLQTTAQETVAPFELKINHINDWPHAKVRWLGVDKAPRALIKLVTKLHHHLITLGFKPEKTPFVPHITLARRCKHTSNTESIKPITWSVKEFCLVKSTGTEGTSNYEIVKRWPLK